MRIGKQRTLLTIEQLPAQPARDAIGGEVEAWAPFATWFCELVQVRGGEVFRGHVVDAQATSVASGHYIAGVTRQMRAVLDTRTFDIVNVNNVDEASRELRLELRERGL